MSILLGGEMTEEEGFILEAADQCGFEYTDDDCEFMRAPIDSVVLFALINNPNQPPEMRSILAELLEAKRQEWLSWVATQNHLEKGEKGES